MIPIKIKGKKYRIKSIAELTTKEFIELSNLEGIQGVDPLVSYIAWQTGENFNDVFFASISRAVEIAIGRIPDVPKMKRPEGFNYKLLINTVGQRHQVETCKLEGYELLVFCLAVSQARSNNIDDINALVEKYQDMPFNQIMPAGFFFYKNLGAGRNFGLRRLRERLFSIRIRRSRNKQESSV